MKQSMGLMSIVSWMAGVCCLWMALCGVHSASAQQDVAANHAAASTVAASAALPTVSTFAPATFSALMPGVVAAHPDAKPASEEQEESPKPSKPGSEGVKVHGHWVLQVKNADGTFGERREFENSLVTTSESFTNSGSALMVAMLSGNAAVGDPAIGFILVPPIGDPSGDCSPGANHLCFIFATSGNSMWYAPGPPGNPFPTVFGLSGTANFTPNPSIVLSGNYVVPGALGGGTITAVQSLYGLCVPAAVPYVNNGNAVLLQASGTFRNADLPSNGCSASALSGTELGITFALTATTITSGGNPAPLAVTTGQVITVTVTISFS